MSHYNLCLMSPIDPHGSEFLMGPDETSPDGPPMSSSCPRIVSSAWYDDDEEIRQDVHNQIAWAPSGELGLPAFLLRAWLPDVLSWSPNGSIQ